MKEKILIVDFGSQYSQLIARRIREFEVYSEIIHLEEIEKELNANNNILGIILSGGPSSVYSKDAPLINKSIFDLNIPILGICYGMQVITHLNSGEVRESDKREFGKANLEIIDFENPLFKNVENFSSIWMSHSDHITKIPENFEIIGKTDSSLSAIYNRDKNIYALQFHPEVTHSEYGTQILENFVFTICKANKNWKVSNYINNTISNIKDTVGNKKVVLGLSGGVDSSVAAILIQKAIGDQLICVFVDTGLLRQNEVENVTKSYKNHFNLNIKVINAKEEFYNKLKNITDPEEKRKIIGHTFIDIFNSSISELKDVDFLAQGTIYPDIIESKSVKGPSQVIKSHHNVGGLPEDLNFKLLEPLKELFKDEVRKVGLELGIDSSIVNRHPFPGPGLGIRILGEISEEKVKILQQADNIFIEELHNNNLYNEVSQAFVALLPVKSVGVMGDYRTYEYTAVVRSVNTYDFMTATWSRLPYEFLERVSNRICNEVKGINRVVYDITSKPPATIEWE